MFWRPQSSPCPLVPRNTHRITRIQYIEGHWRRKPNAIALKLTERKDTGTIKLA
jgi:hypothetical protein